IFSFFLWNLNHYENQTLLMGEPCGESMTVQGDGKEHCQAQPSQLPTVAS
ncbi:hypothetical protein STEG23_007644, partial [Scotinomys teguina]